MRRLALCVVTAALAAATFLSCRDATAPLTGAGMTGTVLLDKVVAGKITICHAAGRADDPKFNSITVSENAARAHFDEHGSAQAGHESDYLVTGRTPCPPPATPGTLRVCKVGAPGILAGTPFTIDLNGQQVIVLAGQCITRTFRVGTRVKIAEIVPSNTVVSGLAITPDGAGTTNLAQGTATIVVGTDVATLTITNRSTVAGTLAICKVAGVDVTPGTNFTFTVAGVSGSVSVAAGAAPTGTCSAPMILLAGPTLVDEPPASLPAGTILTSVAVSPEASRVSSTTSGAVVQVTAGEATTVTFANGSATVGALVICKVAGAGIAVGRTASFNVPAGGPDIVVAAGAGPTGTCSPPRNIPAGTRDITEVLPPIASDVAVQSVAVSPSSGDLGAALDGRRVLVAAGVTTTVTFTNVSRLGALIICKVAGAGIAVGRTASFNVPAGGADIVVAAGAGPTGTCSPARNMLAGTRDITEILPPIASDVAVQSVDVSPSSADLGAVLDGRRVFVAANTTTTVTFTNVSRLGALIICKVAGAGIAVGRTASFNVPGGGADIVVAAGAGPTGTCSPPRNMLAGTRDITEILPPFASDVAVQSVDVSPSSADLGAVLNGRQVSVAANTTTTVTFTNVSRLGALIICKVAGPNITIGRLFTFNVPGGGADIVVAAGAGPTGTCSPPRNILTGTRTITEAFSLGASVTSVVVSPPSSDGGAAPNGRIVTVPANATTTVTFTNTGQPPL